ncbi:hypothetical protein ANN_27870 [Periplaneta americana]|uniref:Uncharacterized protein n=1 Tax=Periplaneta americana TaxID=6978 RepID=A0ABQ8RVH9_PERAM|nr:hypothetical protein ANN_27870 [Periplaneta americana]
MAAIKMEPEVDPLAVQPFDDTIKEEEKPAPDEGNLLDLHVTRIKEEYMDDSYNHTSEIKSEPNNFPVVKCEAEVVETSSADRGHVLGQCPKGELLINARHHHVRHALATSLKTLNWEIHEEVHCVSSDGSFRRADIVAINGRLKRALVLDPTIRFERNLNQATEVGIEKKYPPQNWLHLYTDGSLISREQGAGAGVTCCLFSLYRSLGYGTTSFDGEIIAISESLKNLLCHINKFRNAVILSHSKAAILSIVSKHTPSSQTAEITKMLSQLISLNKRIVFQWIPFHCGILGNENADALAKKGSTATYRPVTKSTYYSVKRFIKSTYLDFNKQNLITQSQGKKWNSLHQNPQLIPDLPRKSCVAVFRLATGMIVWPNTCIELEYISPLTAHCATQTKKWIRNTSKSVLQWLVMIISLKNIGVQKEELCDLDIVKDELDLEVTAEENEIFPDRTLNSVGNETAQMKCTRAENSVSEYSVRESTRAAHLSGQLNGRKRNLELQSDNRTAESSFECNICGKLLQSRQSQRKHLRIHTAERRFKCDTCGKYFLRLGNLKSHVTTHTGEKAFKCDDCGKCFARSSDLTMHAHTHSGEKPFKCNICGKCFVRSSVLALHSITHSGAKPYKCDVCGKCFARSGVLTEHARTHSGERPYQCDVCGKCFARSRDVTVHARTHSGQKPFKCNVCGKCFVTSGVLALHARTHSGAKPYKCDVCGKTFAHSGILTEHARIHSGEKPYQCNVCGKCFARSRVDCAFTRPFWREAF